MLYSLDPVHQTFGGIMPWPLQYWKNFDQWVQHEADNQHREYEISKPDQVMGNHDFLSLVIWLNNAE